MNFLKHLNFRSVWKVGFGSTCLLVNDTMHGGQGLPSPVNAGLTMLVALSFVLLFSGKPHWTVPYSGQVHYESACSLIRLCSVG